MNKEVKNKNKFKRSSIETKLKGLKWGESILTVASWFPFRKKP